MKKSTHVEFFVFLFLFYFYISVTGCIFQSIYSLIAQYMHSITISSWWLYGLPNLTIKYIFKIIREIKKMFGYGLQHHSLNTKIVEEKLCKIRLFNYRKKNPSRYLNYKRKMYIILFFNLFFKKNVGHTQLHVYKCESYQAFSYDFLTYM